MSREEIKNIEGTPFETDEEMIIYDDLKIVGKDVQLAYYFNKNDQAYKAVYMSVEEHTNLTDYVIDYNDFVSALTEKYGSPKEDKTAWKNNLYKDTPSDWGLAVALGHLVKFTTWETENASIRISLTAENNNIYTFIAYRSTKIDEPVVDRTEGL